MKFIFTSIALLSYLGLVQSQDIAISDPGFLEYLIDSGVDVNQDGIIQVSEAEQVTEINISGGNYMVSNIIGVKEFINLENLYCTADLTELDISDMASLVDVNIQNTFETTPSSLSTLDINHMPSLESLTVLAYNLNEFDISLCPKLKYLTLSTRKKLIIEISNFSELTLIDFYFFAGSDLLM